MSKFKFHKFWYLVGLLLLANTAVVFATRQSRPRDHTTVNFFDVGQGDATYLRTPRGSDILVDAGPGDVLLGKLGAAMPFFDRTIELAILTHPHADHITGMIEVLKRYNVRKVILPEADYDSQTYRVFLDLLSGKHVAIVRPKLGERIFLDNETVLDIDYPVLGGAENHPSDINDVSIVARLSFGQSNVLLMGDAGKDIEQTLLAYHLPLDAEILKVGHHGSRHSTSVELLKDVNPRYGVISVGAKNTYGHPHEETLQALASSGVEILRTDERGDVAFALYPDRVELQK